MLEQSNVSNVQDNIIGLQLMDFVNAIFIISKIVLFYVNKNVAMDFYFSFNVMMEIQ
jgi:hypothetical protein